MRSGCRLRACHLQCNQRMVPIALMAMTLIGSSKTVCCVRRNNRELMDGSRTEFRAASRSCFDLDFNPIFENVAGEACEPSDLDGFPLAGFHKGVRGGSSYADELCGLFDGEE
jgi:hypothetical protein